MAKKKKAQKKVVNKKATPSKQTVKTKAAPQKKGRRKVTRIDSRSGTSRSLTDVVCEGISSDQLRDELQLMEAGQKTPRRCYVCKRSEGVKSVSLTYHGGDDKDDSTYSLITVELAPIRRTVSGITYHYRVCLECAILLESLDQYWGARAYEQERKG